MSTAPGSWTLPEDRDHPVRTSEQGPDPDYYTKASLESLRLAMWCKEHRTLMFFCEHRH